ncbi:cytochrome P450 [Nonomuraea sp. JJY05]|uniref:cytochrome P450 n=1 Tax=Nonomuraea sp. JJY05 TaxID=3350255 RepID=UPI00373F3D1B
MFVRGDTLFLLFEGYGWLPALRRRASGQVVHTRLMGRRAVGLCGPETARFFYDEDHVRRHAAVPEPVKSTLLGHGAVHTLDADRHRVRKAMFMSLLTGAGVPSLVTHATECWDEAVDAWARSRQVRGGAVTVAKGSALDVVSGHRDADGKLLDPRVAAVEVLNVIRPAVAVCWFVTFAAHALHRGPEHRAALRSGDPAFAEAFAYEVRRFYPFAYEVRRFYPFAPFVAGRAVRELSWAGERIPAGCLVLLDVYGQNHDPGLWEEPYAFDPGRFAGRRIGAFDLTPQGGGDPAGGHRCPGEDLTIALLQTLAVRLARLEYDVPRQDLSISLRRIPARPASGFVMAVPDSAITRQHAGAGTAPKS